MNEPITSSFREICPRDGKTLTTTTDYMFLLRLLSARKMGWKYFVSFFDSASNSAFYLGESFSGQLIDPITGEFINPVDGWVLKERVRCRKVSQHYFETFYGLRSVLRLGSLSDLTIRIGRMTIFHDGTPRRMRHALFNWWLRYPMREDHDPLLQPPADYYQRVAAIFDGNAAGGCDHRECCPLDGPVAPIEVHVASPSWTWKRLCGRQWTYSVCPKCLFQFDSALTVMN